MSRNARNKRSADMGPAVVTAPTLKEAYRLVRQEYGDDAVILGSRTVNQRHELGFGHERRIEVSVQLPGAPVPSLSETRRQAQKTPPNTSFGTTPEIGVGDIIGEVDRLEKLVEAISADFTRISCKTLPFCQNVVAETLIENGASAEAVNTLLMRYGSETAGDVQDRPAVLAWLTDNLRTSNCSWDDLYGCHAFLGETGSGRTEMILSTAAMVCKMGRRTLVLSLMPRDHGDIRRLQLEASEHGFDAAVIKKTNQLASLSDHLSDYEVVLVDMPHFRHPEMVMGGEIHQWLAQNTGFHRHMLVPLDKDPRDLGFLRDQARHWNCDWIAVSRLDMTDRTGKLLDVLEMMPLPISLLAGDPDGSSRLEIAHSDSILDKIIGGGLAAGFTPGLDISLAETGENAP